MRASSFIVSCRTFGGHMSILVTTTKTGTLRASARPKCSGGEVGGNITSHHGRTTSIKVSLGRAGLNKYPLNYVHVSTSLHGTIILAYYDFIHP